MPVETNLHRAVSNRGQWRGSYLIVMPDGPGDASTAVFSMSVYPMGSASSGDDYGFRRCGPDPRPVLSATTDDATSQFTLAPVATGLACAWLFPAARMRALCRGSYQASLSAAIGDEDAELARINFVVR